MSLATCHKCWTNPCTCGEQFKHVTTDHILSLIDALTEILKDRNVTVSTTVNNQLKLIYWRRTVVLDTTRTVL